MKIKTIVVEDDPLARKRIEQLLATDEQIEMVGSCRDGDEAVAEIDRKKPDLVFLDVQLPTIDGFEVLNLIDRRQFPQVIFATASDQHAIRAFEYHAVDYLLKPFDDQRFQRAISAAKERILHKDSDKISNQVQSMIHYLNKEEGFLKRFLIKQSDRIHIVPVDDILWIEAEGYNIRICTQDQEYKLRETLKLLEAKLDPAIFLRIHRSYIVNVDYIKEIQEWFKGDYMVILKNEKKLTISKSYYRHVINRLKQ